MSWDRGTKHTVALGADKLWPVSCVWWEQRMLDPYQTRRSVRWWCQRNVPVLRQCLMVNRDLNMHAHIDWTVRITTEQVRAKMQKGSTWQPRYEVSGSWKWQCAHYFHSKIRSQEKKKKRLWIHYEPRQWIQCHKYYACLFVCLFFPPTLDTCACGRNQNKNTIATCMPLILPPSPHFLQIYVHI